MRPTLRRTLLVALGGYVAIRLVMLASVVVTAHLRGDSALGKLTKADGYWYLRIAAHGYGPQPPKGPDGTYTHTTTLAFFPLYSWLIRAVHTVAAMPYEYAALLITAVAGIAAAAFITLWAVPIVGGRAAVVLTLLWSILPTSVVLDMAYSEGLFVAAAAGCLLALQRQRWLIAALACTVAGLTRPTAAGLLLGVWIALVLAARRDGVRGEHVLAAVVAPVGLAVSLGHVAIVTGRLDGWFWLERTVWRSGFDGGSSFVHRFFDDVVGNRPMQFPVVMAAAVVLAFIVILVVWLRSRPAPADAAYVVVAGLLAIGERNYPHVKPRFLLVCFPVLVPVARALARWRTPVLLAVAAPVFVASVAWNTYLVDVWRASV